MHSSAELENRFPLNYPSGFSKREITTQESGPGIDFRSSSGGLARPFAGFEERRAASWLADPPWSPVRRQTVHAAGPQLSYPAPSQQLEVLWSRGTQSQIVSNPFQPLRLRGAAEGDFEKDKGFVGGEKDYVGHVEAGAGDLVQFVAEIEIEEAVDGGERRDDIRVEHEWAENGGELFDFFVVAGE
jgi:hypothetical protein